MPETKPLSVGQLEAWVADPELYLKGNPLGLGPVGLSHCRRMAKELIEARTTIRDLQAEAEEKKPESTESLVGLSDVDRSIARIHPDHGLVAQRWHAIAHRLDADIRDLRAEIGRLLDRDSAEAENLKAENKRLKDEAGSVEAQSRREIQVEKLAGNIVKEEHWKGQNVAARIILQAAIAETEGE